jgi:AraC family transcriptional regulator
MLMADVHILHRSGFYKIVNYTCHCTVCSVSDPEYNGSFNLSFVRKGFFEYRTYHRKEEAHTGRILISKPGYEHITRHIDNQPDITTTLEFKKSFYQEICEQYKQLLGWFLTNNDIHSVLVNSNPELEYLHFYLLNKINSGKVNSLQTDELVIRLLQKVMDILSNASQPDPITDSLKKYHLNTIASAKDYLLEHFKEDISLQQLAQYCHVSLFHFSRIFKTIMKISPHQFLASVRLNHAKILLETTGLPVTDISFDCGFNSLEHFVAAYKKQFAITPSSYRNQLVNSKIF